MMVVLLELPLISVLFYTVVHIRQYGQCLRVLEVYGMYTSILYLYGYHDWTQWVRFCIVIMHEGETKQPSGTGYVTLLTFF